MTPKQYLEAKAGILSNPQRFLVIGKRQPTSIEELDALALSLGVNPDLAEIEGEPVPLDLENTPEANPADQEPAETPPVTQPTGETTPDETDETIALEDQEPAETPPVTQTTGETQIEIPAELQKLKLADLRALAAQLGIDPVPAKTKDVIEAIEALRKE